MAIGMVDKFMPRYLFQTGPGLLQIIWDAITIDPESIGSLF